MKITSGEYKGISLFTPKTLKVRPTLSIRRQAIFNMIRENIKDSICADFFAGVGSLGFEALSNGAKKVFFIEKEFTDIIYKNAKKLNLRPEKIKIYKIDFRKGIKILYKNRINLDVIFVDPPYNKGYIKIFLQLLNKFDILKNNGIIIFETHKMENENIQKELENFNIIKEKKYGETYIYVLNKKRRVKMVDINLLKKMNFFSPFTEEELKVFAERLILEEYDSHYEIFRENQIGDDSMFIIVEGAIKIVKKAKNEERVLANLKDGEFFGEMSMLYPAPRSAGAVTIKPTKVLRFSDRDYNSFKKDYPSIVVKLNEIFIKILVQRLRDADKKLVKNMEYGIGAL